MAKFYDTLLWEYIKNPWRKWLSLDDLAVKYFDYKMISYDEVTDKKSLNFIDVDLNSASNYSIEDIYITKKLYELQTNEWLQTNEVLHDIEMPLSLVLCEVERNWVKIDDKMLLDIWENLKIEIEKEKQIILNIAWVDFNINSPKQVWDILFEKMWLPNGKKTKTWYSVDVEVLEYLAIEHPIAKHILNYRQYSKLLSTYVEWLLEIMDKNTKKVHTNYNQTIASTWRLSSTNPNLQNIPSSSSGVSGEIRKAFIPYETDDVILAIDYSQIEVRLLAIMSWDENLMWAFKNWIDIHSNTGYFLFAKDNLTSDERRIAKAVNFGVIYGISPFWLSKMISIPQSEAREYINKFYEKYPKVLSYFDKVIKDCEKTWFVQTMFWRKRYISWINDKNSIIKKASEREAINMPIQWTSADIIKIAMIKIAKYLKENWLKTKMIMQVHDELVFNVPKDEIDIISKDITFIMENIITSDIKLKADFWYGKNWKEAK